MWQVVLAVFAILTASAGAAAAQEMLPLPAPTDPLEPRQAARSGYAPQGVRLGAVDLFPEAEVRRVYREEAFAYINGATQRGWSTAAGLRLRAEVRDGPWAADLRGDLERASGPLALVGDGWQGGLGIDLRLGLGRVAVARVDAGWQRRLEPRAAPLAGGQAATPVPAQAGHAGFGLWTEHGTLTASLRSEVRLLSYGDVPRLAFDGVDGLALIINDDRDRLVGTVTGEIAWRPGGVSALYLRGAMGGIDYNRDRDDFLYRRDAVTRQAFVGAALGRPESWRLFLEVGHISRDNLHGGLPDVARLAVNGGATVVVTPLVTAQVLAETVLAETTRPSSAAVLVHRGRLEVEHEALRSLVLLSTAEVAWHEHVGLNRVDTAVAYGSGLRWRIGPILRLEAMVRQEEMLAGFTADSYVATEGTLRLAARF